MTNKIEEKNGKPRERKAMPWEFKVMAAVVGVAALLLCGVIIWLICADNGSKKDDKVLVESITTEVPDRKNEAEGKVVAEVSQLTKDTEMASDSASHTEVILEPISGEKGEKGEKGDPGRPGKDGAPGKNGSDGQDGKDGNDGRDGLNGRNGKDGKDGKTGRDGINGRDGLDGNSTYVAYSDDKYGSNMTLVPNEKTAYIGICTTRSNVQPTEGEDYVWQPYRTDANITIDSSPLGDGVSTFTISIAD